VFVSPNKYRLSAYCASDSCTIIQVEKERLESLFEKNTAVGYYFMKYVINVVGERFNQIQDEVANRLGEDIMNGW